MNEAREEWEGMMLRKERARGERAVLRVLTFGLLGAMLVWSQGGGALAGAAETVEETSHDCVEWDCPLWVRRGLCSVNGLCTGNDVRRVNDLDTPESPRTTADAGDHAALADGSSDRPEDRGALISTRAAAGAEASVAASEPARAGERRGVSSASRRRDPETGELLGEFLLEEIVVTASRIVEPLRTAPARVEVIRAEEIVDSGSDVLGDLIEPLAGVNVARYGSMGQLTTGGLRGSTYQQVLFLFDGRPLYDPHTGGFDMSAAGVNGYGRVEALLGGASSLYGANALGGVVNLIPKVFDGEGIHTKLVLEGGSHGTSLNQAEFGTRISDRADLYVTAENRRTGGIRANSDSRATSAGAKVRYWLTNRTNLSLDISRFDGELGVPGSLTWPSDVARQEDRRLDINLGLDGEIGRLGKSKVTAYASDLWYEYRGDWSTTTHSDRIRGGIVQHTLPEWRGQRLTIGGEAERIDARVDGGDEGRSHREGVWVRAHLRPIESLSLVGGVRYDDHSQYGSHVSPSVNIGYEAHPGILAFAGYSHSFRAPTLNDLDPRWNGDPDLLPEQADAVEVGLREYGLLALDGQISAFARRTEDEIVWVTDDWWTWYPKNFRRTEAKGVEVSVSGELESGVSGSGAYTYSDVVDRETEKALSYRPLHKLSGHLQYRRRLAEDRVGVMVRVGGEYVGARYADTGEEEEMEGFALANGRAVVEMGGVSIYYEVRNIFDGNYQYVLDYPMPRRTMAVGIGWEL